LIDPALQRAIHAALEMPVGGVKRSDLFLVCKLWNTYHSKEGTQIGLTDTLKNIGLEYLDW
jgi:diketogulonate reductase-like aldo/keto reductase